MYDGPGTAPSYLLYYLLIQWQEYTPNRYGRMRKRRKLSSPAEQPSDRRRTPAADPDATKEYDPPLSLPYYCFGAWYCCKAE
jgi:hypothetical protein